MQTQQRAVDLNCDVGEGFGPYSLGDDRALLAEVTSANVACGGHAGDPSIMRQTVDWAKELKVAVGAHPGFPDREGFGRRRWDLSPQEVYEFVLYQIGALAGFVKAAGIALQHVKPHGALYNMASTDEELAQAISRAVYDFDPQLILVGLAGSKLIAAGESVGLQVGREAFADRSYEEDGSLTPRGVPGAVIDDPELAAGQVVSIVRDHRLVTREGKTLTIDADTVCIHGDRRDSAMFARHIRQALQQARINITPMAFNRR